MFSFLAYIFKIIISLGVGYIIGYNYNKKNSIENFQLYSSLSCFSVASITGLIIGKSDIMLGLILFAIIHFYIVVNKKYNFDIIESYKILFCIINGLIIGMGNVFYSIVITILFSYIANNFDIISSLLARKNIDSEGKNKEEKNNLA